MFKNLLYVGLDVHAQTVAVALAESGGEVRNYGAVSNCLQFERMPETQEPGS